MRVVSCTATGGEVVSRRRDVAGFGADECLALAIVASAALGYFAAVSLLH
jgi:hypothetical protein